MLVVEVVGCAVCVFGGWLGVLVVGVVGCGGRSHVPSLGKEAKRQYIDIERQIDRHTWNVMVVVVMTDRPGVSFVLLF